MEEHRCPDGTSFRCHAGEADCYDNSPTFCPEGGGIGCYQSTSEGCLERRYRTVQECWDRQGFPVHPDALTDRQAKQQCQRLQPLENVSWHGAPSRSGTFVTKAVCLGEGCEGDGQRSVFSRSYLDGCQDPGSRQSPECVKSQQRWEKKRRKGCIVPTVTQFVPQYDSQSDVLKAPLCVGTTTWEYEKEGQLSNGITFVACFAKDRCESCPCNADQCYDPAQGCLPKTGTTCPAHSRPAEDCHGGGKTQQLCASFGTQLMCPSADECMSGENALRPQQVSLTEG